MTTEEFIAKSKNIHGNILDYSLTYYTNYMTKLTLICPIHGEFRQTPKTHYRGTGCPTCAKAKKIEHKRKLEETKFLQKSKIVHGSKYDYSKTVYIEAKQPVTITCPIHGDFKQRPFAHLKGQNCPICGDMSRKNKRQRRKTGIEKFIEKAINTHGNLYDYTNTKYTNAKTKLAITCKTHGEFTQLPNNHINGSGCPKCQLKGYSDSKWEILGKRSKYFESFKLYILECWSESEKFIKIGKTFTSINKRFKGKADIPYQWKLLYVEQGTASHISKLERQLHKQYKQYKPKLPFCGSTECFNITSKEQLTINKEQICHNLQQSLQEIGEK